MKTLTKLTGIALLATTMAGCATTTTTARYSEDNSRAYNLAQAGGLHKARDTALGDDEYSSAMTNITNAFSDAALFNSSAGLGLSGGASLGLGLAGALFAAPGHMERDSAFAFVPTSEAASREEANELLRDSFFNAVQEAAADLGYEVDYKGTDLRHSAAHGRTAIGMVVVSEEDNCYGYDKANSADEMCIVTLQVPELGEKTLSAPQGISVQGPVYAYPATDHKKSMRFFFLPNEDATMAKLPLAVKISEHMPEWFFLYLAPEDDQPPMILEKGEPELFIKRA
ncbi:hypothetical protein [Halomonas sp. C05BenzN]|uniref:hypothetical protein n=1 Tax=Halomonas sp. C05BenzN TaxID=3411041 RepID=UPI003B92E79E